MSTTVLPVAATDRELLACALDLPPSRAGELLTAYGDLRGLARAGAGELRRSLGSRHRAARAAALLELSVRLHAMPLRRGEVLSTPERVYQALWPRLRDEAREVFLAVPLDARHRVIAEPHVIAVGHLTGVEVHPREVFRPLVRESAARALVVHNHPSSGSSEPSPQDLVLTARLRAAGEVVGIALVDHVVVAETGYVSLHERGVI